MKYKTVTIILLLGWIVCTIPLWSAPSAGELQRFFDERVTELLKEYRVAGAVVGVTGAKNALFQKGYGQANVEKGLSVDAEKPLFRPGSISKLFTWTAIMQMKEAGRLELTARTHYQSLTAAVSNDISRRGL